MKQGWSRLGRKEDSETVLFYIQELCSTVLLIIYVTIRSKWTPQKSNATWEGQLGTGQCKLTFGFLQANACMRMGGYICVHCTRLYSAD